MMIFTPYHQTANRQDLPKLPLRESLRERFTVPNLDQYFPATVLDAEGYRDFLDAALAYGNIAIAEFAKALKRDAAL